MRYQPTTNPFAQKPRFHDRQMLSEKLDDLLCMLAIDMTKYSKNLVRVQRIINPDEIWPDQCEFAINILNSARNPINKLNKFLAASPPFPRGIRVNRYSILTDSYYAEEIIDDLIALFQTYKKLPASQQEPEYRREIVSGMKDVMKNYLALMNIIESIIAKLDTKRSYAN